MAVSPRTIRRRIKSVKNTRKITKAMELVSASKMRRAVSSVLNTRPYAEAAWKAVAEIAKVTDPTAHPLLRSRDKAKRILLVVFTSDRSLCGGYNAQMLRLAAQFLKERGDVDVVAIGKKGQAAMARAKRNLVATFEGLANNPRITDIRTIADLAIGDFTAGKYDAVHVAFTDYRSALTQKPLIEQLLPITHIKELGAVSDAVAMGKQEKSGGESMMTTPGGATEYLFEPSPQEVLNQMLPRLVEAQIYQALLESTASEHSARMMAMRNASDAAGDMIDDLTLSYNQARQAGITREIAEISSGKAALE